MSTVRWPVSVRELAESLDDPQIRVVDCRFYLPEPARGRKEFLAAHIPGAVYADLERDLSAPVTAGSGRHPLPDPDEFVSTLKTLGISNDTQVVAYDDGSGAVAARFWWMLRWIGHDEVALLDGGYAAWMRAQLPVNSAAESVPTGDLSRRASTARVWTTRDVESLVRRGDDFLLVDARDGARYRGEVEPIDNVAGHVPGSVSLPFPASLTPDGLWKEREELAAVWAQLGAVDARQPWGVMCGSGVTACHLALSATLAGLPEPCLYAGSWSEWIRDARRRVATGPLPQGGKG